MARARVIVKRLIIVALMVLIVGAVSVLWKVVDALRLSRVDVASDLYVFQGFGGNSTVLLGKEGSVLIDPLHWKLGRRQQKELAQLNMPPLKFLINTHHHLERTENNGLFLPGPQGVASEKAVERMLSLNSAFWSQKENTSAVPSQRIPLDFKDNRDHILKLDEDFIRLIYVGRGHTDGDMVIYLPSRRVVITGDLVYNGYYPLIDHEAGGSYLEWISALDEILRLGPQRIIPGYGPVTEPAEVKAFQGYLRDLVDEVAKMKAAGKTREQVQATLKLPVHEERLKPIYHPVQQVELSNLKLNAGDVYDELEAGGRIPPRPSLGVDAQEGEPEDNTEDGSSAAPTPKP
ncbi:MAG: MBL fold metallo-hydrolase [Myxococcota bacterium]